MPPTAPLVPIPYALRRLDEIDSTNAEAMRLAAAGERGPLWITAASQTLGRGRSGRQWQSVPGNLFATLLLTLECETAVAHQLSLVAGVAAIEAVRAAALDRGSHTVPGLRLKWPNDLLIGADKFGGILPESVSVGAHDRRVAAIGIGMNLAGHPQGLDRGITHLAAHGLHLEPDQMLQCLVSSMDRWLLRWDNGAGFATVRTAWLTNAGPAGEAISINTGRVRLGGTFIGIDSDGALLLRDASGLEQRFTYGDVSLGAPVEITAGQR